MHSLPHYPDPDQLGNLSQARKLHGHLITTQSPQFTSGFTLGVGQSVGLGKRKDMYLPWQDHTE